MMVGTIARPVSRGRWRAGLAWLGGLCLFYSLSACDKDSDEGELTGGEAGGGEGGSIIELSPGGAQDFGLFRSILEEGGIPGPETLDDAGFFAEHYFPLPDPDCGGNLCLQTQLGSGRSFIDGSRRRFVLLGLGSPIDPDELEPSPLNLVVAVDTGSSLDGSKLEHLKAGLHRMRESLGAEDRLGLVTFGDRAEVAFEYLTASDPQVKTAIDGLRAEGPSKLYDGLRRAYELAHGNAANERQNRVVLLSDGEVSGGLGSSSKIVELSTLYGREGIALSTIGLGDAFDVELMRRLAEGGSGNFHFLEGDTAVEKVFADEAEIAFYPIARTVELRLKVEAPYRPVAVYGSHRAHLGENEVLVELPHIQFTRRESSEVESSGRRGGGGVLLVELESDGELQTAVGTAQLRYRSPTLGDEMEGAFEEDAASLQWPSSLDLALDDHFGGQASDKAFVVWNLYRAFFQAAARSAVGDYRLAVELLNAASEEASPWSEERDDPDIEDDLFYGGLFVTNLERALEDDE